MKTLSSALEQRLNRAATTLARCWLLRPDDGTVLGFTDHDGQLTVGGTVCEPQTALQSTETVSQLGFAADNSEVAGALIDTRINDDDIETGRFDGARLETWLVDWTLPDEAVLLHVHYIGEIIREDGLFRAELRGRTSRLDRLTGRAYDRHCDAELGDARCGVDLADGALSTVGTVEALMGESDFSSSAIAAFEQGWFAGGTRRWITGPNAGKRQAVSPAPSADLKRIELWLTPAQPIAVGDTFEIKAGCDKRFATCRKKFFNARNFRGFPHIPGDDFAFSYAGNGTVHDGSPLVEDDG